MKVLALLCTLSVALAAIIGIDLGHQFTKAMLVAPGIPFEIVFTDEGKRKDFSGVSVKPVVEKDALVDTDRVYGSQIGSLCSRFPESCATNLKALLGKLFDDPAIQDYLRSHHGVAAAKNEDRNSVMLTLGSGANAFNFSVEELAAMSLHTLKERVLKALDNHSQARSIADDVAISVLPYASQLQRHAYLDTLDLAGFLHVLGLVDEGSAVALGYISGKKFEPEQYDGKTIYHVIYDVGAGSTTATLFSYTPFENKTIEVDIESVGYDESFGGELLTRNVYDILYAKFLQQFSLDDSFKLSPKLASRLTETAEKAKVILSANSDYRVTLESFYEDKDLKVSISREEFEEYSSDILERAIKPILDALADRAEGPILIESVESVILNGGATRTPFIQKQLTALLGGEDKIAKVVNTDEACALGTTMRAYQLKMISANYEIMLKDRILSNFEISLNDSDEQLLVFAKGSLADNTTQIPLGKVSGDEIDINLYENGGLVSTYTLTDIAKKTLELSCEGELELTGTFKVDVNKIFTLNSLSVKCPKQAQSETSEPVSSTETGNSTDSSNTTTTKKSKRQLRIGVPLANFASIRPLNRTERLRALKTLTNLKAKDQEKILFDEVKNQLESACYSVRAYIDDHYEALASEKDESELDSVKENAGETVEWLEYDSDSASLDEIKDKLTSISAIREEYELIVKMVDADLSMDELVKMKKEGTEIASQVQEYLLEYGSQIQQLRGRYEDDGFDFDAENNKIMSKIHGDNADEGLKLDSHFSAFKEALKELSEIIDLPKNEFKKLTKAEIFLKHDALTKLIYSMMQDVMSLQDAHKERVEYLLVRHKKLSDRKSQKEFRRKLKEEKEAAQKESTEEEPEAPVLENDDDGFFVSQPSASSIESSSTDSETATESVGEAEETSSNVDDHDEL